MPTTAPEITSTIAQLRSQLDLLTEHWGLFSEAELRKHPGPGRWSRKEILGHLIDSATNNHARFVKAQILAPLPLRLHPYDQLAWVRLADYQHLPAAELLALWTGYNRLILHLLGHIPESTLTTACLTLNGNPVTLHWLIDDYVLHLEHHVRQIINDGF
jgi:DinB superfamily